MAAVVRKLIGLAVMIAAVVALALGAATVTSAAVTAASRIGVSAATANAIAGSGWWSINQVATEFDPSSDGSGWG
jgi:P2-related tail formation protein